MATWPLAPHTGAKHLILRKYLEAWFPILGRFHQRLVFVDGFAGPGEYSGGEPGSPLIAIDVAKNHARDLSNCQLDFVFIESDDATFQHLSNLLRAQSLPPHLKIHPIKGGFAEEMPKLLDELEQTQPWPPTFVMIDPFGFSHVPFSLIQRLALSRYPRTEILVSLMTESINRFLTKPELAPTFDSLFGCSAWRQIHELPPSAQRWNYIQDLYKAQLEGLGFHSRTFGMRDEVGHLEYFLMFGTKSREGLKQMKAAMWKTDPSGNYRFSDTTDRSQLTLFGPEPDLQQLRAELLGKFAGLETTVQEVEDFVIFETAFRETHYKKILASLEREALLEVPQASSNRKRGTFAKGEIQLRFA